MKMMMTDDDDKGNDDVKTMTMMMIRPCLFPIGENVHWNFGNLDDIQIQLF